jgi:cytochrome c oxidase assembly protein subunit 15
MQRSSSFLFFSRLVLVMVLLVILAGAVVRTTQSGMGCPDWPTCFGKWIPPTSAEELPPDFERYLRQQDIDHTFNAFHTWTEYLNRLLGALLGLLVVAQLVWGFFLYRKQRPAIVWACLLMVLLTGFQGWLGKKVVDANLAAVKVTVHLFGALAILALSLVIVFLQQQAAAIRNKRVALVALATLLLLLVQMLLGTAVRSQIDVIAKSLDYGYRELWIGKLNYWFYIHRSFSIVVTALCVYQFWIFRKYFGKKLSNQLLLACVAYTVAAGVVMAYFYMPAWVQPVHLLFSSLLFAAITYNVLIAARFAHP